VAPADVDMEELELELIDYDVEEVFKDEDSDEIIITGAFESNSKIQEYNKVINNYLRRILLSQLNHFSRSQRLLIQQRQATNPHKVLETTRVLRKSRLTK
jgi:protein associated with RNAse G/E